MLGEIYAQAFSAAGYNVKTALNLGDEQTALKALKGGQISGYPEYTGTALLSFLKVPADKLPNDEGEAYDKVKSGMAKEGIEAFPPTPFTSSNEVGLTKKKATQLGVTKISDLKPKAARAHAVRLARVPHATRLPPRPGTGLRAEVQEVRAGRHRPAPRGADQRAGRRLDRLHHRPTDQAQRRGPARGRQGHVPALQLDLPDEEVGCRQGGPGPGGHDRRGEQEPHRRRHAGAQRARRPRQGHPGAGRAGLPASSSS